MSGTVAVGAVVNDLISLMMLDKVLAAKVRQAGSKLARVHAGEITIEQAREESKSEGPDALDKYLAETRADKAST